MRRLHLHDTRILPVYQSGGEKSFAWIVSSFQDVHGHLHDAVASRRIDKGGIECAVGNHFHSHSFPSQGIYTDEEHVFVAAFLYRGIVCPRRHTVVVGKNKIDARLLGEDGVKSMSGRLSEPSGISLGYNMNAGSISQRVHQSAVAVPCRSGTFQSRQFNDIAFTSQAAGNVDAYLASHFIVVGTDIGCVMFRVDFAVYQYDRNPLAVGFFHDGSDGFGFIGSYDYQVDFFVDKVFDVGYLALVVISSRADFHFYSRIEQSFPENFLVHLVAPFVVAALRHADDVTGLFLFAGSKEQAKDE